MFCVKYRKKLLSRKHNADTTKETIIACETDDFHIQVMEVDADHIHLLLDYSPDVFIAQIVCLLKQMTTSKLWFCYESKLRQQFWKEQVFWSSEYFACSAEDASTETIARYIEEQR